MNKAVVSAFYSRPWKILPVTFLSSSKVCFGDNYVVEFNPSSGLVVLSGAGLRREIAKLEPDKSSPTSIEDFRGVITGNHFSLLIEKGAFLGGPSIALKVSDGPKANKEIKLERIQMLRDFNFGGLVHCRFLDGEEKLEIVYEAEWQELAQVIGAVLLQLLISAGNTRGAQ